MNKLYHVFSEAIRQQSVPCQETTYLACNMPSLSVSVDVASCDDQANFGALPLIYGGILCPPGFPQEGVDTK